jgi:hypothetical protein
MDPVDDLYSLPPAEFTAARDALAKRLKAEGDKDAAAEVKKLRRPTVGAWAINTVARQQPDLVDAVYEAGAALGEAQRANIKGTARDALRSATAARRDAVSAAVRAAVALAGEAHRDGIAATFEAAAAGDESVRHGRLGKELDAPSGFGVLGELPDLPDAAPEEDDEPEPEPEPEVDEEALRAAEEEVAEARKALQRAEDRLARAEAALADLRPD